MLMIVIVLLSVLRCKIKNIVRLFSPFIKWCASNSNVTNTVKKLKSQLTGLLHEQKSVSMMDEFPKYAKLQRKIDKTNHDLKLISNEMTKKYVTAFTIMSCLANACVYCAYLYLVYYYRYEPVMNVNENLLYPKIISKIVAFPIGTAGNVGCIFWIMVCQISVSTLLKLNIRGNETKSIK